VLTLGGMETVVARVLELLAQDVVEAIRKHDSYRQLVESLATQSLATAAGRSVVGDAAAEAASAVPA
jgi:hypothetical protein